MNKGKHLLFTIFTSGLATFISFAITFFLTPYITRELGAEAYGFVTLSKNFVSYATIITIALNSYAARYIAIAYHNKNIDEANKYFSSVLAGDFIVASAILLIAVGGIACLERILNISSDLVSTVKILFVFVFINFYITTIGTAFSAAAYIKNHLDKVGIFKTISFIVEVLAYVILFKTMTPKVWHVGVAMLSATLVIVIGNIYIHRRYTPELSFKKENISVKSINTLVISGIWNSINSLGNTLNSGLDLIVTNLLLSSIAMGQLAITKTIAAIFASFNQMLAQPFQPLLLKSYSEGDKQELVNVLKLSMKVSGLFSCLAFSGFFALGVNFYSLWIPEQNIILVYRLTVITIFAYIIEGPVFPLYYIYTLTVKNKIPCIITLIGGAINVIAMYLLIRYTTIGVYAVPLTTTVIMSFINFVTNPLYMTHCLRIHWSSFYSTIFRTIFSCMMMSMLFCMVNRILIINGWVGLVIKGCACVLIGCLIHFNVVFTKKEKHYAKEIIATKLMRKRRV